MYGADRKYVKGLTPYSVKKNIVVRERYNRCPLALLCLLRLLQLNNSDLSCCLSETSPIYPLTCLTQCPHLISWIIEYRWYQIDSPCQDHHVKDKTSHFQDRLKPCPCLTNQKLTPQHSFQFKLKGQYSAFTHCVFLGFCPEGDWSLLQLRWER